MLLFAGGPAVAGGAKTVQVKGYTKKDGTYVAPYSRSAPNNSARTDPPPSVPRTTARENPPVVIVVNTTVVVNQTVQPSLTPTPTTATTPATTTAAEPGVPITLTPGKGGVILLAYAPGILPTAYDSGELRAKWEVEGKVLALKEPTPADLLAREGVACKVRVNGKVWFVSPVFVPKN